MFLHKHLVFFLCLNAFVASATSNNSKGNDSCVQETVEGFCCVLPFTYKGTKYDSCTKKGFSLKRLRIIYLWCVYDQANENYAKCKEPIYRFSSTPATETTTEKTTHYPSTSSWSIDTKASTSSPSDVTDEVVYAPSLPRRHSTRTTTTKTTTTTTTVAKDSQMQKGSSETKQKTHIILACGIGGGIILVMVIILTIIIYLKRKNKMEDDEDDGAERHELNRMTCYSNNPVYESVDKDLDINSGNLGKKSNNQVYESVDKDLDINSGNLGKKSNNPVYESVDKDLNMNGDEQQALQPAHVYHELEKPRSSTSCTDDYSLPNAAEISNSYGPKITPALNDTDSFTHFNELYISQIEGR